MRKDLGVSEGFKMSFKEFAEEVNEWEYYHLQLLKQNTKVKK